MHEFHGTVSKVRTLFIVYKVKQILSEYSSVSVNTLSDYYSNILNIAVILSYSLTTNVVFSLSVASQ